MNCQTNYDSEFEKVESLSWLPWVGEGYEKTKFLVVGESHYNTDINDGSSYNKDFTRAVISREKKDFKTYENLCRIFDVDPKNQNLLWENVAFYNYVQKMLDWQKEERPTEDDYANGVESFLSVLKILKPKKCLFVGVRAADYLKDKATDFETLDKTISGCHPRRFSITLEGHQTEVVAIKHPGSPISIEGWKNFLKEQGFSL